MRCEKVERYLRSNEPFLFSRKEDFSFEKEGGSINISAFKKKKGLHRFVNSPTWISVKKQIPFNRISLDRPINKYEITSWYCYVFLVLRPRYDKNKFFVRSHEHFKTINLIFKPQVSSKLKLEESTWQTEAT